MSSGFFYVALLSVGALALFAGLVILNWSAATLALIAAPVVLIVCLVLYLAGPGRHGNV